MKTGLHTYYTFQHRRTHVSPWLKAKPLKRVVPGKQNDWTFSSWDFFGREMCLVGAQECHQVWSATGSQGYWTLSFARESLERLRKADARGAFDTRSGNGNHEQSVRHEFRLVKVTTFEKITPVL